MVFEESHQCRAISDERELPPLNIGWDLLTDHMTAIHSLSVADLRTSVFDHRLQAYARTFPTLPYSCVRTAPARISLASVFSWKGSL